MKCPTCRHYIPDTCLVCPTCAERRCDVAVRLYQHHPLRLVAQHHGVFTTRMIASLHGAVKHVQMFGCEKTFCGVVIESHHRRGSQSFDSYTEAGSWICETCRANIDAILKEALCSA